MTTDQARPAPAGYQALRDAEADAEGAVRVAEVRLVAVRRRQSPPTDPAMEQTTAAADRAAAVQAEIVQAEEELAAAVRRLQRCRDATVTAATADTSTSGGTGEAAEYSDRIVPDRVLQYTNSADWGEQYLLRMWRRQNVRWCAKWFLHGEALTRLEALWRSWEFMRYEGPTAMAVWWRDYADYHLRELTSKTGPFERCNAATGEHQLIDMLPVEPAPDELRRDDAGGSGGAQVQRR